MVFQCNTETLIWWNIDLLTELPRLHSVLELSSATQNTLTIHFNNWTPENDGGTQPRGYHVERRLNGSMEWIPGPRIDHDTTVDVYALVLKNLEPDTSYYVRVTPFIEDGGNIYNGNAIQEAGPFLTLKSKTLPFTCNNLHLLLSKLGTNDANPPDLWHVFTLLLHFIIKEISFGSNTYWHGPKISISVTVVDTNDQGQGK